MCKWNEKHTFYMANTHEFESLKHFFNQFPCMPTFHNIYSSNGFNKRPFLVPCTHSSRSQCWVVSSKPLLFAYASCGLMSSICIVIESRLLLLHLQQVQFCSVVGSSGVEGVDGSSV
jgi:hypothetical protein